MVAEIYRDQKSHDFIIESCFLNEFNFQAPRKFVKNEYHSIFYCIQMLISNSLLKLIEREVNENQHLRCLSF